MKIIQKYVFPPLLGFVAGAVAASASLMLFVNRYYLIPNEVEDPFASDAVTLPVMMALSAFLLYAALLLGQKLGGRLSGDPQQERSGRFTALFLLGAALAAGGSLWLAMANEGNFAAMLVMICYMLVSDLIVIAAFLLVVLFVRWVMKLMGKDGGFLYQLKWQFPLSLLWFAVVFAGLLAF